MALVLGLCVVACNRTNRPANEEAIGWARAVVSDCYRNSAEGDALLQRVYRLSNSARDSLGKEVVDIVRDHMLLDALVAWVQQQQALRKIEEVEDVVGGVSAPKRCANASDLLWNNVPGYADSVTVVTHELGDGPATRSAYRALWHGRSLPSYGDTAVAVTREVSKVKLGPPRTKE